MKIGEGSAASGVSQRMIRHYEGIGLIGAAPRRDSGYRDYCDADLNRLRFIANARSGFSDRGDKGIARAMVGHLTRKRRC